MKRINDRMMPNFGGPSFHPAVHANWHLDTATAEAKVNTLYESLDTDRKSTFYLNEEIEISSNDKSKLKEIIGKNRIPDYETRSVWFDLEKPIDILDGKAINPVVSLQVKGVVFDEAVPPKSYGGVGWRSEYYFADKDSYLRGFQLPQEASGYCTMCEAVNEFIFCREASKRMEGTNVEVPLAIAWGEFENGSFDGDQFGYVVLGLPELIPGRDTPYYEALTELSSNKNFSPMKQVLTRRANAMSTMHKSGLVAPFRHFGNMSLTRTGNTFMHDLGDRRALTIEQTLNVDQFIAETFANLSSALTPADIVIPGAKRYEEASKAIKENLEAYTKATLTGYYGENSDLIDIPFDEIENTFFFAFEKPLNSKESIFSQGHYNTLNQWLKSI